MPKTRISGKKGPRYCRRQRLWFEPMQEKSSRDPVVSGKRERAFNNAPVQALSSYSGLPRVRNFLNAALRQW